MISWHPRLSMAGMSGLIFMLMGWRGMITAIFGFVGHRIYTNVCLHPRSERRKEIGGLRRTSRPAYQCSRPRLRLRDPAVNGKPQRPYQRVPRVLAESEWASQARGAERYGELTSTDLTTRCRIIQADQLGVSISRVLSVQADQMRQIRRQRAEELAAKAPLKMLFPMILLIFPAIFIVILGPSVPELFGGGGL